MQYLLEEWPDNSASLVAEDGFTLETFENIVEAIDECMVEPAYIERHTNYSGNSPHDFESGFV